jgi:hypothetical protein
MIGEILYGDYIGQVSMPVLIPFLVRRILIFCTFVPTQS